jgi:hypothetical protein
MHIGKQLTNTEKLVKSHTFACVLYNFFFNSHSGGWSPYWVHSACQPINGLLYLLRVIMMMEYLVEWRLAGETEALRGNLPQRHFVHHKSHLPDPGRRGGKLATNCLSYDMALCIVWLNFEAKASMRVLANIFQCRSQPFMTQMDIYMSKPKWGHMLFSQASQYCSCSYTFLSSIGIWPRFLKWFVLYTKLYYTHIWHVSSPQ